MIMYANTHIKLYHVQQNKWYLQRSLHAYFGATSILAMQNLLAQKTYGSVCELWFLCVSKFAKAEKECSFEIGR